MSDAMKVTFDIVRAIEARMLVDLNVDFLPSVGLVTKEVLEQIGDIDLASSEVTELAMATGVLHVSQHYKSCVVAWDEDRKAKAVMALAVAVRRAEREVFGGNM